MKINFLFSDFRPTIKCGEALAAVTSVLSGTYNAKQSQMNVHSQLNAQSSENAINRDWQTEQAEIARQYNTAERIAAQSWSEQMLDKQNQYSSPAEQVKRYQQAGINPAVAMSSGMQSVSVSPSSGSPQSSPIPSGVSGLSPVGFQPSSLNIGQLMNGVGSMFRDLAQAKQLGVNTDIISQSAEYLIKNNMLTAEHKQLAVDMLRIDKVIKDETKDASISRAWDESKKAMYDALISSDEQSRQQLYSRVLESQKNLNDALANYHGKNAELLCLDIFNYNAKLNAYLNLSKAQTKEAASSASLKDEQARFAKFDNDLRSKYSADVANSYIKELTSKGLISSADGKEALRKLSILEHLSGDSYIRKLDEALEWIKGKISIFGK